MKHCREVEDIPFNSIEWILVFEDKERGFNMKLGLSIPLNGFTRSS